MVLDRKLSRRRLLQAGAAGAAAAALIPIGSRSILAAQPAGKGGRLIPAGKVGTITFTQRDVPNRLAHRGRQHDHGVSSAARRSPKTRPISGRSCRCPAAGRRCSPTSIGSASIRSSSPATGRTPPTLAARPDTQATTTPPVGRRTSTTRRRLRGLLDDAGLEAIGNHGFIPNTWNGPSSAGGAMSANDLLRFQTELEFGAILGTPYLGTGQRPDERATTVTSSRGPSPARSGTALNEISVNQFGIHMYPHNH